MVRQARIERRYDLDAHRKRIQSIIINWEKLQQMVDQILPQLRECRDLIQQIGLPTRFDQLGIAVDLGEMICLATKEIRSKYVASKLLDDLCVTFSLSEYE